MELKIYEFKYDDKKHKRKWEGNVLASSEASALVIASNKLLQHEELEDEKDTIRRRRRPKKYDSPFRFDIKHLRIKLKE